MNSDEVRDIRFLRTKVEGGYVTSEVDDLLDTVAVELDAGRPAEPLIAAATFRTPTWKSGYDIDAVDWFLDQLRARPDDDQPPGNSTDPWQETGVITQLTHSGVGNLARPSGRAFRKYFAEECANAWRDFGQLPGPQLRWERAGKKHKELRTAQQQTIASRHDGSPTTVSAGGRNFTLKEPRDLARSAAPGVAELADRSYRDYMGHYIAKTRKQAGFESMVIRAGARDMASRVGTRLRVSSAEVRELADEAGVPVLYTSGRNFKIRAWARISYANGRWLRFLVRGTHGVNAIMTAVDQAGNQVARYRIGNGLVEIIVHPDRELADDLVLAIALSADWLGTYFDFPTSGS